MDFDHFDPILGKTDDFIEFSIQSYRNELVLIKNCSYFGLVNVENWYSWKEKNKGGRGRKYPFLDKEQAFIFIFTTLTIALGISVLRNSEFIAKFRIVYELEESNRILYSENEYFWGNVRSEMTNTCANRLQSSQNCRKSYFA